MAVAFFLEVVLDSSSCIFQLPVEIAHPDHYQLVISSSRKIVAFLVELDCPNVAFMAEDCPAQSALLQVPDLYFVVGGDRGHVVAEGVEGYPVDLPVVGIVVLDQFSQPGVPNFNGAIHC